MGLAMSEELDALDRIGIWDLVPLLSHNTVKPPQRGEGSNGNDTVN